METLHTESYRGHRIDIWVDPEPLAPDDRDPPDPDVVRWVTSHRRYTLGRASYQGAPPLDTDPATLLRTLLAQWPDGARMEAFDALDRCGVAVTREEWIAACEQAGIDDTARDHAWGDPADPTLPPVGDLGDLAVDLPAREAVALACALAAESIYYDGSDLHDPPLLPGWDYLPLFLYDHGGLSLSTGRVCAWDSGRVGAVYYRTDGPGADGHGEAYARALIAEWGAYLTGSVYGFTVEPEGPDPLGAGAEESCGGFYGDGPAEYGGALSEARAAVDAALSGPSAWERAMAAAAWEGTFDDTLGGGLF